ncbi:MAG: AAA family ATPase [Pirellulales bacterium]
MTQPSAPVVGRLPWPAPFPGLAAFQEVDADLFFGRGETIDELLRRLERQRFLVVVGPSGAGKTSLIQAGLLPALAAGNLAHAGSSWWHIHVRVEDTPLTELADAIWRARHAALGRTDELDEAARSADREFIEATLRASDLGLVRALHDQGWPEDAEALVWVEQADPLIRAAGQAGQAAPQNDVQALFDLLLAAARQSRRRIHVVLTLRADSLDACQQLAGLPEAVNAGLFILPRMSRQGLQDAIEGPLERFSATWEPEFVTAVLNDVEGQADPLPRFQQALLRTWYRSCARSGASPPRLTLADYRAVGGFRHSIAQQAGELLEELRAQAADPAARQRVTPVVTRLRERLGRLDPLAGERLRAVTADQIREAAGAPWEETRAVLARLARHDCGFLWLDALDADSILPETRVSLAHESLLRFWPAPAEEPVTPARTARRDDFQERRRRAQRDRWWPLVLAWLLASAALGGWAVLQSLQSTRPDSDGGGTRDRTASAGRSAELPAPTRAADADLSSQDRSGGAATDTAAQRLAQARHAAALSAAAREHQPVRSLVLAAEAARRWGHPPTLPSEIEQPLRSALEQCSGQVLPGHLAPVGAAAWSSDGRWVATIADQVRVWDLRDRDQAELLRSVPWPTAAGEGDARRAPAAAEGAGEPQDATRRPRILFLRFGPAASRLEWLTAAGELWSWNLAGNNEPPRQHVLPDVVSPLRAAANAPDGRQFATCDHAGAACWWNWDDATDTPQPRRLNGGGTRTLAFSGDGRRLATAGGLTQVWEAAPHGIELRATLLAPLHFEFTQVALSHSGRWIAAADAVDNVFLWDDGIAPLGPGAADAGEVRVRANPVHSVGRSGPVSSLLFDSRDRWLAVGAADRAVQVVWLTTPDSPEPADGTSSAAAPAPDSPAADSTAAASPPAASPATDSPVTDSPLTLTWSLPHAAAVTGLAASADGRWLYSVAVDGAVRLWEMPPRDATAVPVDVWQSVPGPRPHFAGPLAGSRLALIDGAGQLRMWGARRAGESEGGFLLPPQHEPLGEWIVSPLGERLAVLVRGDSRPHIAVWRLGEAGQWLAETRLAVPDEFTFEIPPQLRFDAEGESLVAINAARLGEPSEVALWRLPRLRDVAPAVARPDATVDAPAAVTPPRRPTTRLRERFGELRFGARWLVLVTPGGQLRVWSQADEEGPFVERSVPAHAPAREVWLSPNARRLAVVHAPTGGEPQQVLLSLWGPGEDEAVRAGWVQLGYWELPPSPSGTSPPSVDVRIQDRWLVALCGRESGVGSELRGWRVDAFPPHPWKLTLDEADLFQPQEFQLNGTGDRLLVEGTGESRLYALEEVPRELRRVKWDGAAGERPTWSRDGRWLAVVQEPASLRVWDLARSDAASPQVWRGGGAAERLFFDRRGESLFALHPAGYVRRWPTAAEELLVAARAAAGRNLTQAEWEAAFGEAREPFQETFAGWGPGTGDTPGSVVEETPAGPQVAARPAEDGAIRYCLESLPEVAGGVDAAARVRAAWELWAAAGSFRVVEVGRDEQPHVVIRTEKLDGPGGVPAHGQLGPPQEGLTLELRLDREAEWTDDLLQLVAAHEIGHLLGLTHTPTPGQLMSEDVPAGVRTPQEEDLRRLRELWPAPPQRPSADSGM